MACGPHSPVVLLASEWVAKQSGLLSHLVLCTFALLLSDCLIERILSGYSYQAINSVARLLVHILSCYVSRLILMLEE